MKCTVVFFYLKITTRKGNDVKQRELRKLWTFGRLEQMFRLTPRNESLGLLIKSEIKSSLPNVEDILISLNE